MQRSSVSSSPDTTAPSSSPEQAAPHRAGSVAIHQPNLFPRLSTLAKLYAADCVIVLDDVQFTRRDYQHRTRLAAVDDAERWQWLSLDTHLPDGRATLICDAHVLNPVRCRRRIAELVRQHYRKSPHWTAVRDVTDQVLERFDVTDRTADIAEASTTAMLSAIGWTGQTLHSASLPSAAGRSERLADLATLVKANSYLCGTGGMRYLDGELFKARRLSVVPVRPPNVDNGGVWTAARTVSALRTLALEGPIRLAAELDDFKQSLDVRCEVDGVLEPQR